MTAPDLTPEQRSLSDFVGRLRSGETAMSNEDAVAFIETVAGWAPRSDVARMVADAEQRGAARALTEIANAWQFGGWTELTSVKVGAGTPALAYGQVVTDWLRARAALAEATTPEEQR